MVLIKRGDVDVGLRLLGAAVDELREAKFAHTLFLGWLAEGFAGAGQAVKGLTAIGQALTRSEVTEERWAIAELLRIKGELLLVQDELKASVVAEEHFLQALDWARRQDALSWELRAATSVAQLWHRQGRTGPARELLAPIYRRFTEGFGTADLRAAKALLDTLH
jgi:predicted ATPase